ncbi:MAG: hypothetical protein JW395_3356 [Nitrospira sp.]|nr:hypothetical protein [Nitrospira sp.]
MAQRIEWRTMGEADDAIVVVDEDNNAVDRVQEATPTILRLFLNDIVDIKNLEGGVRLKDSERDPDTWGELIMARGLSGEVLDMDPELFWDGIYTWFRSRGVDPNLMVSKYR